MVWGHRRCSAPPPPCCGCAPATRRGSNQSLFSGFFQVLNARFIFVFLLNVNVHIAGLIIVAHYQSCTEYWSKFMSGHALPCVYCIHHTTIFQKFYVFFCICIRLFFCLQLFFTWIFWRLAMKEYFPHIFAVPWFIFFPFRYQSPTSFPYPPIIDLISISPRIPNAAWEEWLPRCGQKIGVEIWYGFVTTFMAGAVEGMRSNIGCLIFVCETSLRSVDAKKGYWVRMPPSRGGRRHINLSVTKRIVVIGGVMCPAPPNSFIILMK